MFDIGMIWNIIMTIATSVVGYFYKRNDKRLDELSKEIISIKVDYARKQELKDVVDKIDRTLERIDTKIDQIMFKGQ